MKLHEALAERAKGKTICAPNGATWRADEGMRVGLRLADLNEDGWGVVEEKPVKEKPKAKTEIWPVDTGRMGLHYHHVGTPPLSEIVNEPRWTGRYEFTLPSGRKILAPATRMLVCVDEYQSVTRCSDFSELFSNGWTLAVPTGVEVLA